MIGFTLHQHHLYISGLVVLAFGNIDCFAFMEVASSAILWFGFTRFGGRCRESALDLNDMMTREYCTPMVKSDYTMCILETMKALEIVLIYTCTSHPSPRFPGMLPHSGNQRPPGTEIRIRHRRDFARRTRSDRETKSRNNLSRGKETI